MREACDLWEFASLRRAMKTIDCSRFMKEYNAILEPIEENPNAIVGAIVWI